jgi:hypothetical protein
VKVELLGIVVALGRLKVIVAPLPPVAIDAVAAVDPERVHVHVAVCEHVIV